MAVVAVHDADFFNYTHVIPNLECAKLCAYNRDHNNVTVFTPLEDPTMYTTYYLRKDYDDQNFPDFYFEPNVICGGRAFTASGYCPLDTEIEHTLPDFSIYEKYVKNFKEDPKDKEIFKDLLTYGHVRLTLDGENLDNPDFLIKSVQDKRGIIIHDWDISLIPNFNDMLVDLSGQRRRYPLKIGNKFPIKVQNAAELAQWANLPFLPNMMNIQYDGLMDEAALLEFSKNKNLCSQLLYNPLLYCTSEQEFIDIYAIELFKQILFLRRIPIKTALIYDPEKIKTRELRKYIELLNIMARFPIKETAPRGYYTLFNLCRWMPKFRQNASMRRFLKITDRDARFVFKFFYDHNNTLFKMFYEWDKVYLKGGIIYNEYDRD